MIHYDGVGADTNGLHTETRCRTQEMAAETRDQPSELALRE